MNHPQVIHCVSHLIPQRFIAIALYPHTKRVAASDKKAMVGIDPVGKLVDLIYFDGPKNAQRAGRVM